MAQNRGMTVAELRAKLGEFPDDADVAFGDHEGNLLDIVAVTLRERPYTVAMHEFPPLDWND